MQAHVRARAKSTNFVSKVNESKSKSKVRPQATALTWMHAQRAVSHKLNTAGYFCFARKRKSLSAFYILKDLSLTKINFEKYQAFSFKELFGLKINLLSSLTSLPRFLHIH